MGMKSEKRKERKEKESRKSCIMSYLPKTNKNATYLCPTPAISNLQKCPSSPSLRNGPLWFEGDVPETRDPWHSRQPYCSE